MVVALVLVQVALPVFSLWLHHHDSTFCSHTTSHCAACVWLATVATEPFVEQPAAQAAESFTSIQRTPQNPPLFLLIAEHPARAPPVA